ncbi:hypothetical protein BGX33_009465 [Mortierella sp. NVP41]|nr:hypothetical protein BGX33_009465 [Mortierella sp. NVP41]
MLHPRDPENTRRLRLTTPPTAPTVGHRHQGVDPAVAVSTSAGAQSSSNNADPNCSNNNNSNVDPNRKRRGNLPKSVTSVLKSWLVQNAIHPYPTEEEKMRLSEATQLSMNQISNWFINARRRILQPILHEAAAAAVAGTDAPVENVLIVRKGKGSRMHVEMEGVLPSSSSMSSLSSHPPAGPSSSAYSTTTAAGSAGGAGVTSTAGNNESESNSREESASLAPIKSASHSSSPQPQPHPQSQPPPQPILSA